jgi:hypothetical protein
MTFMAKMSADIDDIWYRDFNRLLRPTSRRGRRQGSFVVHAAALRQAYEAFLAGGHEVDGAIYVLEGIGPGYGAKQELIQAAGEFERRHLGVHRPLEPDGAGGLGPASSTTPRTSTSAGTIQQGSDRRLRRLAPAVLQGNVAFAGSSMAPGLHYLADLNYAW